MLELRINSYRGRRKQMKCSHVVVIGCYSDEYKVLIVAIPLTLLPNPANNTSIRAPKLE